MGSPTRLALGGLGNLTHWEAFLGVFGPPKAVGDFLGPMAG